MYGLKFAPRGQIVAQTVTPDRVASFAQGDTFVITGLANGTDATGYGQYVVVPSGSETLTGLAPGDLGGDLVSGAMLNPTVATNTHGLDARVSGTYDAGLSEGATIDVTAGDIVLKARSLDTPVVASPHSDGYLEAVRPLWVVDAPLGANDILLSAVGWTGRPSTRAASVDLTARYADLTKRDMSSQPDLPDYATTKARLLKYPAAYAIVRSTNSGDGYENLVPEGFNDEPGSGYDRENADTIHAAGVIALDDGSQYTYAERFDLYRLLVRIGLDCALPVIESTTTLPADGGHAQSMILPAALALHALGRESDIADLRADLGGSLLQWFVIDQTYLDAQAVAHDDIAKNCLYRRRTLGAQSAAGANEVIIPTIYGGAGGRQGDWMQNRIPAGSTLVRPSDGATATVAAAAQFPSGSTGTLTVSLDANLSPALTSGDVIHFTLPPGFDLGDAGWSIRSLSTPSWVTLSAENEYTNTRREGDALKLMEYLGILPAGIMTLINDFCTLSIDSGWPSPENTWPDQGAFLPNTLSFAPTSQMTSTAKATFVASEVHNDTTNSSSNQDRWINESGSGTNAWNGTAGDAFLTIGLQASKDSDTNGFLWFGEATNQSGSVDTDFFRIANGDLDADVLADDRSNASNVWQQAIIATHTKVSTETRLRMRSNSTEAKVTLATLRLDTVTTTGVMASEGNEVSFTGVAAGSVVVVAAQNRGGATLATPEGMTRVVFDDGAFDGSACAQAVFMAEATESGLAFNLPEADEMVTLVLPPV